MKRIESKQEAVELHKLKTSEVDLVALNAFG